MSDESGHGLTMEEREALKYKAERQKIADLFALVFSSIDGQEVLRLLKEEVGKQPFVILTDEKGKYIGSDPNGTAYECGRIDVVNFIEALIEEGKN